MEKTTEIQTEIKSKLDREKQIENARKRITEAERSFVQRSEELPIYERLVHGCFRDFPQDTLHPPVDTQIVQSPAKKTPTRAIKAIIPETFINIEPENPNTHNNLDVQWESLAAEINSQAEEIGKKVDTIVRSIRIKGPATL
ncbi:MAG: hypothetical protein RBS56_01285 [Candidatus Gracilibacteria bacterium]|jgi:hypothetical protein|nr:hypothetical protein [Candidatus Gracilibacteria bacterium]